MSHLDPDVAALIAIGDTDAVSAQDLEHLEGCAECADEIAAFAMAAGAARGAFAQEPLLTPPPRVWEAISAEVGITPHGPTASPAAPVAHVDTPSVAHADEPAPHADAVTPSESAHTASGVQGTAAAHTTRRADRMPRAGDRPPARPSAGGRAPRRSRRLPILLALVGTFAAVAVVVGVWASVDAARTPRIVAEATLDGFPGHEGAVGAAVLEDVDGHNRVVVSLDASVPDDGYREVWLIAEDGSDLVSLGVLEGREGEFDVPADVDLDTFRLVDISQEEEDGNPAHSGDSIVRGALQPA